MRLPSSQAGPPPRWDWTGLGAGASGLQAQRLGPPWASRCGFAKGSTHTSRAVNQNQTKPKHLCPGVRRTPAGSMAKPLARAG